MQLNNFEKQKNLQKMKNIALFILFICTAMLVFAHEANIRWLKACMEAAIVGGLADWFAVVALFKYPMGIPIPHTALIPKKKDSIAENLGKFISDEFLTKEHLSKEVANIDIAKKLSEILGDEKNARKISEALVANVVPGILKVIKDEDVKRIVSENINLSFSKIDIAGGAGKILYMLTKNNRHQDLLTKVLDKLSNAFSGKKQDIRKAIEEATPFGTGFMLDNPIYDGIVDYVDNALADAKQENSDIRKKFDNELNSFILNLQNSNETKVAISDFLKSIAHNKEFQEYISGIWEEIKQWLNDDAQSENSKLVERLSSTIQALANSFGGDENIARKINDFVKIDILDSVVNKRNLIGDFITKTVQSWDSKDISSKLELEIGKDLQYIRLNGTVVGGLIGLAIYAVSNF